MLRMEGAGAVFFDDIEVRETATDPIRKVKVASYSRLPRDITDRVAPPNPWFPTSRRRPKPAVALSALRRD